MAAILVFTWGTNAVSAEEGSSLSVAPGGQIIVKGAQVVSISGNVIVAETAWGAASLSWIVQTSGSTKFVPEIGSVQALRSMKPGHTIAFTGTLVGSLARPTVIASVVKDTELVQEFVSIVGSVESVDAGKGSFVLSSPDSATTVVLGRGALMSRDGENAGVENVSVGDSGKATGTLDTTSGILVASRISIKSAPVAAPVVERPKESMFSSILTWIMGSRGILSVRDR